MKYYVVEHSCIDLAEYPTCSCSFLDVVPGGLSFSMGEPLPVELTESIKYNLDKKLPLDDYPYTNMFQFLVSKKLMTLVESYSSVTRRYSSSIFNNEKLVSEDYVTINFEKAFPALNRSLSIFQEDDEFEGRVVSIDKLVIDASRVPQGEHIFRMFEEPEVLLVSEVFKVESEKQNIQGLKFVDLLSDIYKVK